MCRPPRSYGTRSVPATLVTARAAWAKKTMAMTRRWLALGCGACVGVLSVIVFGIGPRSWWSTAGSLFESCCGREATCAFSKCVSEQEGEPAAGRALLVSTDDFPGRLERPPVKFDHDKHTFALQPEGCEQCHREDQNGDLLFTYPKVRDGTGRKALMNSFHDDCIGCHQERRKQGKEAGPVTCGECHVLDREYARHTNVPVLPEYDEVLRDTYHRDCIACHREPAKMAENAGALDWKSFYVAQKSKTEERWPKVDFDYFLHDKHDKALEGKCQLCHYISPARQNRLSAEGKQPAHRDWLLDIDETNDLSERAVAHARCINCHLKRRGQDNRAGPVSCGECHNGVQRTIEQMADVPRPKCDQEDRILMRLDQGARAKAVAFNHASHVASSRSCQECHHKTLRACRDCHGVKGSEEGGWVTLAEAHHKVSSNWSCVGCHEKEKSKPDCAGCHQGMQRGLVQSACSGCHTGSLDKLDMAAKLPAPEDLIPADTKPKIQIGELEDAYAPSTMPHLAIAKRLTDLSNSSTLARHFHTDPMTICAGCHHLTPLEAKTQPPRCSTCHTVRHEPIGKMPTLLGAYHQQCLGCHRQMDRDARKMPQSCTGCHEEKSLKTVGNALRGVPGGGVAASMSIPGTPRRAFPTADPPGVTESHFAAQVQD